MRRKRKETYTVPPCVCACVCHWHTRFIWNSVWVWAIVCLLVWQCTIARTDMWSHTALSFDFCFFFSLSAAGRSFGSVVFIYWPRIRRSNLHLLKCRKWKEVTQIEHHGTRIIAQAAAVFHRFVVFFFAYHKIRHSIHDLPLDFCSTMNLDRCEFSLQCEIKIDSICRTTLSDRLNVIMRLEHKNFLKSLGYCNYFSWLRREKKTQH